MFRLNKSSNSVHALEPKTFGELGFRERQHLQEWIAKQPSVLGEDLLIIQKEFSGFDDTNERLDLLALDGQGNLVVIENKLDDSGKNVTWQALKYASYCSSLSKIQIARMFQGYLDAFEPGANAEDRIVEFLRAEDFDEITLNKGISQRIILIAANFRKEVTSTVLWLMNYKVRLQCFKVTPFAMGEELFLTFDQIIPTKDAEEYMIGMADKAQEDIEQNSAFQAAQQIRRDFFARLIPAMNATGSTLYQNISPSGYHWIGAGTGVRQVSLNFVVTKSYGRAELYIDPGDQDANKAYFDELFRLKDKIEADYGGPLIWERLDGRRACRIKAECAGNVFDRDQWDEMVAFMADAMFRLEKALKGPLKQVQAMMKP